MLKAFLISVTIFGLSAIFLIIAVCVNMGFVDPMFDSRFDTTPYIEQMRAIIHVFDKYDKVDALITVISACSSAITGLTVKIRG